MKKDLISIIVPVYKAENFLERCVRSILAQTYNLFEVFLVDDGSPDSSPALCDKLAKIDKRINVIHKENGGPSSARNAGLDKANGEFVCFVDSDDEIAPRYLEVLHDTITKNESDVAICMDNVVSRRKTLYLEGVEEEKTVCVQDNPKIICELYDKEAFMQPWNKLYKKELITKNFPLETYYGEDDIFNLNYFLNVKKVSCTKEVLYTYYYSNTDSITKKDKTILCRKRAETIKYRYDILCKLLQDEKFAGYYVTYPLLRNIYYAIDGLVYLKYSNKKIKKALNDLLDEENVAFGLNVYYPLNKKYNRIHKKLKTRKYGSLIFVRRLAVLAHKILG